MMKQRLITFILLSMVVFVKAIAADTADALLGRAADKLRASKSVTAQFTLSAGGNKSAGKIILAGERFHVSTADLTTWYDGNTQWTYVPSADEVNITTPTPEELQQVNPFAIINAFRRSYKASFAGKTATTRTILLSSTAKAAEITTVTVTLNTSTLYPIRIAINLSDGNRLAIDVAKVTPGGSMPASAFKFDRRKYPRVEVVDLR